MSELNDRLEEASENLGEEISELEEFEEYRDRAQAYEDNAEAQSILTDLRTTENKLRVAVNDGDEESAEELRSDLSNLEEELHSLEVVQDYDEASKNLEAVLTAVNERISETLGLDFARFATLQDDTE